jgi:hypothetical protein
MTNFATITPSRGDRPELLKFVTSRLRNIPSIIIDYKPQSDSVDLIPRIQEGIAIVKKMGYDFVFIIEDDDYYNHDYFNSFGDLSDVDFVGYSDTTYYNIKNRTYQSMEHEGRSSLFCTGFRISALDGFNWPNPEWPFLDIRLWEHAQRANKRIRLLKGNPTLGIKHGIGKCAGKGHKMMLKNSDNDHKFLRSKVDEEAFKFYTELIIA